MEGVSCVGCTPQRTYSYEGETVCLGIKDGGGYRLCFSSATVWDSVDVTGKMLCILGRLIVDYLSSAALYVLQEEGGEGDAS